MKALVEHLIVATIAVVMAFVGYWLMSEYCNLGYELFRPHDVKWTAWSCLVSIVTWLILYRVFRGVHWASYACDRPIQPDVRSRAFLSR